MTEYFQKGKFSNIQNDFILFKWKKYILERQKQRKQNIIWAKSLKPIFNQITTNSRDENNNQITYVAILNCDLDIAPYLNCINSKINE